MPTIDYDQRKLIKDAFLEGYELGFKAGQSGQVSVQRMARATMRDKPKRKLSAWNKFVKANSRKKEFRYANGKLKLKKMGIAFRKKRR